MPLRLVYKAQTSVPVEVEGLVPSLVREQSLPEIERFEIFHGNEKLPLAEFFTVSGTPGDERIDFEGNLAGVHWIGAGMSEGLIHVTGDAGRHVGSEMTGGTILIGGEVGNEIGHTMRRGLLAVGGGCGDFVGLNMIAGTIFVLGPCGIRPGAEMRRGTIGLFDPAPPKLLPTFRPGSRDRPLLLQLLFRQLRNLSFPIDDALMTAEYRMYHGDMVAIGRGELLLPEH
jgi:formylmethanofuran dehydrogenase subunit C